MLNKDIPGGIHYGSKLKVIFGKVYKISDKRVFINDTYYVLDIYKITENEILTGKNYILFLVLYNHQWWVFDYICND